MPNSNLFAVNNLGRVFALQTDDTKWEELPYLGIDFKRVSAHDTVVWALGGDHQIYVFVYGTSVPIRVCEESYENQRWNPIEGFTSNLLPSDRPVFSTIDGLKEKQLTDIHLPSLAWNWEGPWHLQDTFDGKALDKECWTYAVDFPRCYSAEKNWRSCVRRRKWVRYRRYIALDTWSAVSSIHKDHTQEPFIDIAIGGGDVVGEDSDKYMVWAITAFGKVVVRKGICSTCPEGSEWVFVPIPDKQDVTCLSVGKTGRVWALTWDGKALVRTGVTRGNPMGMGWNIVEPPGIPLNQIAVGTSVVWGVCRDYSVWFRRGLDGSETGSSGCQGNSKQEIDNSDVGTSWLEMIGSLLMVSVGPNNQVWGISNDDHTLVIRTGVTPSELTGKTWKSINLPLLKFDPDRHRSDEEHLEGSSASDEGSCRSSLKGSCSPSIMKAPDGSSVCSLNAESDYHDAVSMTTDFFESEGSSQNLPSSLPNDSVLSAPGGVSVEEEEGGVQSAIVGESSLKKEDSVQSATVGELKLEMDESRCQEIREDEERVKNERGETPFSEGADVSPQGNSHLIVVSRKEVSDSSLISNDFSHLNIRNPEDLSDSLTSSVISDTVANFIGSDYFQEDSDPFVLQNRMKEPGLLEESTDGSCSQVENRESSSANTKNIDPNLDNSLYQESLSDKPELDRQKDIHHFTPPSDISLLKIKRASCSSTSSLNSEVFAPVEGHASLYLEEFPLHHNFALPEENLWLWVSGSGCWVQSHIMPKWFLSDLTIHSCDEPWRQNILEKLHTRRKVEKDKFKDYDEAIECPSWVVNGQCRYLVGGQWMPATLELQVSSSKASQIQEAFIKIIYTWESKKTTLIPCCSIVLSNLAVDFPAKALISLYTPTLPLQPIPLLFSAEKDAEQWLNHISSACIQFRGLDERPSGNALWAISTLGFIYFHDPSSSEKELLEEMKAAHNSFDVGEGTTPFVRRLERGFRPGCFITVKGRILEGAKRFNIDLTLDETSSNIALHFNPRLESKTVVMNAREHNVWSYEERALGKQFVRGKECQVTILCDDRDMKISVNDKLFHCFTHRVMPFDITHLSVAGDLTITEVIYNYGAGDRTLCEYFWRGVGGHLRVVESGACGVTWGISYDSHVYTYTGVCGGGIYKGNATDPNIFIMSDIRHFYVWENQRWNPLTGFTYRGLPTDRKTWSDQSGRHVVTKESTKVPSRHWQWIGDWTVDHHTPNGVDKDGWQYATDFPMSYHAHRYVTDLVRRRRWVRKCRISTSGPWKQMEKVALIAVSVSPQASESGTVPVWGVSVSNEVVMREGVTGKCPRGTRWSLIPSETPMKDICATIEWGVWAVSVNGQAHLRIGVTKSNPKGYDWVNIDAPHVPLKQVGVGNWTVWAIDRDGTLYFRVNVQPLFPEGTSWERVCDQIESISVATDGSLMAVLQSYSHGVAESLGVIAKRKGVSKENPKGTGWNICAGTRWSNVSSRISIL